MIMENAGNKLHTIKLVDKIIEQCMKIDDYQSVIEKNEEKKLLREQLKERCLQAQELINISHPLLLFALFDAYEATRDERMLQKILNAVSENIRHLKNSSENVKLLSYCYYYTEDEECALLAREMIQQIQADGEIITAEAMTVFRNLVEEY